MFLENILGNWKQKVLLNELTSNWENIHTDVPRGSTLGSLLFLIYSNALAENLSSNTELFTRDNSLISVVCNLKTSANEINGHLKKIDAWAYQWNISFNPSPRR